MSLKKVDGYVVASNSYNSKDVIFKILNVNGELFSFINKGILSSKKRSSLGVEIGSKIDLNYYEKENLQLHNIKELNLIKRFDSIKSNFSKFYILTYLTELLEKLMKEGEANPKVYKLYESFLEHLDNCEISFTIIPFFKLRLLNFLGFIPKKSYCNKCLIEFETNKKYKINSSNWEIFCENCSFLEKNDSEMIHWMGQILNKKFSVLPKDVSIYRKIDSITNQFIKYNFNLHLKSELICYSYLSF